MAGQTHNENLENTVSPAQSEDDEISLLDLLIVLAKRKRMVLGIPVAVAIAAAGISLLLPNIYTGTTRILPPQQSASVASALFNQLGGALGGLAGVGGGGIGTRNPNDLYIGMLRSRTVADNLIARFDLKKAYERDLQSSAQRVLQGNTAITSGRDGIIIIEVDDKDPKRAADLANAYVDELMKLTKVLAVTEASQRRLFFERQLEQVKENLNAAEIVASRGLQKGGLAQVDAQGRSMIAVTARLRAEISAKEVQIGAMRAFAAEGNPELQRTQQELEVLRRELGRVEGSSPAAKPGRGDASASSGLDNLSRLRDVKYHEFLYELLAKQYELAKIDEAKDAAIVQVIDQAVEPDRKSHPRRGLIVMTSALAALLLSVLSAFVAEAIEKSSGDPRYHDRLRAIRRYLTSR